MEKEIRTEEVLRRHQGIWKHDKPFKDYEDGRLALRTYRAINWTHRAREDPDDFAGFLFLMIAFNSLYDAEGVRNDDARDDLFGELAKYDHEGKILGALNVVSDRICRIVTDERLYRTRDQWKSAPSDAAFKLTLGKRDTAGALTMVFVPLVNVRNWMAHGAISWRSRIMEQPVRDGAIILRWLVPAFIGVMLDSAAAHSCDERHRPVWQFPSQSSPDEYEKQASPKDFPALGWRA